MQTENCQNSAASPCDYSNIHTVTCMKHFNQCGQHNPGHHSLSKFKQWKSEKQPTQPILFELFQTEYRLSTICFKLML